MISVSYLKSKYDKKTTLNKIEESMASMIHVDLMDGVYAGESNFTIDMVINDLKDIKKPLDIHLMVDNPMLYIDSLAKLKPYCITIHLDNKNFLESINLIKEYNIKCGVAVKPDEDIKLIDDYLDIIDYCLVMSVYPGYGGQEFIKDVIKNVEYLQDKIVLIGIDGGINEDSIKYLKDLRVDNIISGSYVCMSDDYNERIKKIMI